MKPSGRTCYGQPVDVLRDGVNDPVYVVTLPFDLTPQGVDNVARAWKQEVGGKLMILPAGATVTSLRLETTPIFDQLVAELGNPFEVAA